MFALGESEVRMEGDQHLVVEVEVREGHHCGRQVRLGGVAPMANDGSWKRPEGGMQRSNGSAPSP